MKVQTEEIWIRDLAPTKEKLNFQKSNLGTINNPDDFIPLIRSCDDETMLCDIAMAVRDFFGFDIVSLGEVSLNKQQATGYIFVNKNARANDAVRWIEHYKKYLFNSDPILQHGREQSSPIITEQVLKSLAPRTLAVDILNAMHDFNVQQSIMIPVHNPGLKYSAFRFTSLREGAISPPDLEKNLPTLTLICLCLSDALSALNKQFITPEKKPLLSPKEADVLSFAALGKNTSSIADTMSISDNTVLYHMKNIHKKMNVQTRQHAIAKAITLGLINV